MKICMLTGGGDCPGLQPLTAAGITLIQDATVEVSTTHRELPGDAMHDEFARIESEIHQRLTAVVVADEDRWQFRV